MLLPVGAICIAYGVTGTLPNVYPADYVEGYYPLFLLVMLGVYLAVMATACFVPKLRRYAVHYAYLVAAVFLLVELLDVLTLKTGYLLLPFAPSPDRILEAVPDIFTALFMGLSSSFGALIISEQLGVKAGLGWYINWATQWGEYYKVFASVGIFIIIFYLLINVLFKVRDRVMTWQKSVVRW